MQIRYLGFKVGARSRIYNFDVIEKTEKPREFAVEIQSEAFRSFVKFQDGPDICFKRLEHELSAETAEVRVRASLKIGDDEIRQYAERNSSRRRATLSERRRAGSAEGSGFSHNGSRLAPHP